MMGIAVYKVLVRHVVGHPGAASVPFTFLYRYCFVARNPLKPGRFVASQWFGNTFPVFVPHGLFFLVDFS